MSAQDEHARDARALEVLVRRRYVAIVFCDLVDSTSLLTRLGDEMDELRHDVFDALRTVVEVTGGTEVKSLGDGLMASYRNVEQAARGAEAMISATHRVSSHWPDIAVTLRVGCSAGECTEEDGDWFGVPVVEAARLCEAAAPGEALFAAHTAADVVLCDRGSSVAGLHLKGLATPLDAVSVRPALPDVFPCAPPPIFDPSWSAPFVGRHAEMADLRAGLRRAEAGRASLAAISGPAASGKTRVLGELALTAARDGAVVVGARLDGDGDVAAVVSKIIRSCVRRVSTDELVALTVADLESIQRFQSLDDGTDSSAAGRDELINAAVGALAQVLRGIGTERTVVVLLDDLHQASTSFVLSLLGFVEQLSDVSLFVAFGYRADDSMPSEIRHAMEVMEGTVTVHLDRLSRSDLQLFLPSTTDGSLDAALGVIEAETGGLPGRVLDVMASFDEHDDGVALDEIVRRAAIRACPYKGLLAYDERDADRFTGREEVVLEVLERLVGGPLVAIVGASGVGKSSIARAGVAPLLSADRGAPSVVLSPGRDPVAAFDTAIGSVATPSVVVVDQFEEAFDVDDSSTRAEFCDRIVALADRGVPVVLTVRGDAYGRIAEHARLASYVERGTVLVGPMDATALRRVMTEPTRRAGLRFEAGFVDRVLNDVGDDESALPLLSHALLETWRRRRGPVLTTSAYEAAGAVRGAIARTAETVHEGLSESSRLRARALFLDLVELGAGGEVTRRSLPVTELVDGSGSHAESTKDVLETLVRARLVTIDTEGSAAIAHEALIRHWPRLREWLDEDLDSMRVERQLTAHAREWEASGRSTAELLRGARLEAAEQWLARVGDAPTSVQRALVAASRSAVDAENTQQRRVARRLRRLLAVACVGVVLALIAGAIALAQRRDAQSLAAAERATAELSTVRQMAAEAMAEAKESPVRARNLAVEAYHRRPDLVETRDALLTVMLSEPRLLGVFGADNDGARSIAANAAGLTAYLTSDGVRVWDSDTMTFVRTLPVIEEDPVFQQIAVTPSRRIVVARHNGDVEQWDADRGTEPVASMNVGFTPAAMTVSTDGSRALVASDDTMVVVDLDTSRILAGPASLPAPPPDSWLTGQTATLSGDGQTVVVLVTPGDGGDQLLQRLGASDLQPVAAADAVPGVQDAMAVRTDESAGRALILNAMATVHDFSTGTNTSVDLVDNTDAVFATISGVDVVVLANRTVELRDANTLALVQQYPAGGPDAAAAGNHVYVSGTLPSLWAGDGTTALSPRVLPPPDGWTYAAAPDGRYFTATTRLDAALDGSINRGHVVDLASGREVLSLPGFVKPLAHGLFADVLSRQVRIVDIHGVDQRPVYELPDYVNDGNSWILADPEARWLAWQATDGTHAVHMVDVINGTTLPDIPVPNDPTVGLASENFAHVWSPTGDRLAITGRGRMVVMAMPSRQVLVDVPDSSQAVYFSRDGRYLLGMHTDGVVVLDARDGKQRGPVFGGTLGALDHAATDDAGQILVVSSTNEVQMFDIATGHKLGPALPAPPQITKAVFAPNGVLLQPIADGFLEVPTDPAVLAAVACHTAGSNLSTAEWAMYAGGGDPYHEACPGLPRRR